MEIGRHPQKARFLWDIILELSKENEEVFELLNNNVEFCRNVAQVNTGFGIAIFACYVILNFVSTVGGAPLAVIKQYIENQKNV